MLGGERPINGAQRPATFANFTISGSNYGIRRAPRGGIGVFLSSIGCAAFIFERYAVLVYTYSKLKDVPITWHSRERVMGCLLAAAENKE